MLYAQTPDILFVAVFSALLIAAAFSDVARFKIPNTIVLGVMALYGLYAAFAVHTVPWGDGLLVGAIMLAIGIALFSLGYLGGGDAKLLAATSLWAGTAHLVPFLIVTALIGGAMAMIMMSPARYVLVHVYDRLGFMVDGGNPLEHNMLPYGIAIAGGGLTVAYRLVTG